MREVGWNQYGGVAGILYVLLAVVAGALTASRLRPR